MIFLGFLLFIAAEVAVFVVVADHIGFWWALLALIVVSASGPFIVRRVGLGVLAHTRQRLARGEAPTAEVLDGLMVLIGGLLICTPGFLGDVVGLVLMLRPARHLVIGSVGHHIARRAQRRGGARWVVVGARARPSSGGSGTGASQTVGPYGPSGGQALPPPEEPL